MFANIKDSGEGQQAWEDAGRPIVPSLVIDGNAFPILHPSQIASLLDIELPDQRLPTTRLAWDTVSVLTSWTDILRDVDLDVMVQPTPSRGRSIRNLTVNTFHPFELLPTAWEEGEFAWYPANDAEREAPLQDAGSVRSYADGILLSWQGYLLQQEEALSDGDPMVVTPRGELPFSTVMTSQRYHCSFHHRQIVRFLETLDPGLVDQALEVEQLADINLPGEVY